MSKNGNYEKILKLIEKEPSSEKEIRKSLGVIEISLQAVNKDLKRGLRLKTIGRFGIKKKESIKRSNYDDFVEGYRYNEKWPENAYYLYFCTPESGKLYQKLVRRYKKINLDLINEITRLYRVIETMAQYQTMYAPKKTKLRKNIAKFYNEKNKRVNFTFGKEQNKFLKIIKLTPEMHWLAYRYEKIKKEVTFPMFAKMLDLFNRINMQKYHVDPLFNMNFRGYL